MWPKLSNIDSEIEKKIKSYGKPDRASELNSWIRIFSGAVKGQLQGLILQSNTDTKLLRATGETTSTIYGDSQSSGIIGKDWTGKPVESNSTRFLRPSPIVTGFSVKEGQDQISREATLQLTAYTLEQMEEIQNYFLEPGYSLFIEWGWNTQGGARGVTESVGLDINKILNRISEKTLNFQNLVKTRLESLGEYDGFLGFIVGGSVSSEGETFNIQVNLRGEPSLPTYLQAYKNSKQLSEDGTTISSSDKVNSLFSVKELTDESEEAVAIRRFQYMFNELPGDKQLNSIKNLPESSNITSNMFINFDKHIEKNIIQTATKSKFYGGDSEINKEGIEIQKQDLFSTNRYVRMDLVVEILNMVGNLDRFVVGNKNVSFKINIDNTIIGGFPNIFSTNPKKLIIPGNIPNFFYYFLNGDAITAEKTGVLKTYKGDKSPINPDDSLNPFLGEGPLTGEYKEDVGHWGYLKYLFVNFDILKSALNKKIINSREAFIYILNEMSSAVNAFWKFQIVEGEFKSTPTPFVGPRGQAESQISTFFSLSSANVLNPNEGDIEITVIDENFVGQLPDNISTNVVNFQHNGVGSVFLNANLDISLPSSMVGQIVSSRLGAAINPDSEIFSIGEKSFFNSETDLFISLRPQITQDENDDSNQSPKTVQEIQNEIDRLGVTITSTNLPTGTPQIDIIDENNNVVPLNSPIRRQAIELNNQKNAAIQKEKESRTNNLQAYLQKIDVVPKSSLTSIFKEVSKIKDDELTNEDWFKKRFCIFCFDDSDFFDLLKQNFVRNKYETTNGKSLSTLIPIKYTFTILGNSGIQRGDVFRINGIPTKYSERGIFQVTEIDHTLEQGKWTTQIGGLFRQIQ